MPCGVYYFRIYIRVQFLFYDEVRSSFLSLLFLSTAFRLLGLRPWQSRVSGGFRKTSVCACKVCSEACQRCSRVVKAHFRNMAQAASMVAVSGKLGGKWSSLSSGRLRSKPGRSREASAQLMVNFNLVVWRSWLAMFRKAIETGYLGVAQSVDGISIVCDNSELVLGWACYYFLASQLLLGRFESAIVTYHNCEAYEASSYE